MLLCKNVQINHAIKTFTDYKIMKTLCYALAQSNCGLRVGPLQVAGLVMRATGVHLLAQLGFCLFITSTVPPQLNKL